MGLSTIFHLILGSFAGGEAGVESDGVIGDPVIGDAGPREAVPGDAVEGPGEAVEGPGLSETCSSVHRLQ